MGTLLDRLREWASPAPSPTWFVQLHRACNREGGGDPVILSSWSPIQCSSEDAAYTAALRLRNSNSWGGPEFWPHVLITEPDGTVRSDAYYWNKRNAR